MIVLGLGLVAVLAASASCTGGGHKHAASAGRSTQSPGTRGADRTRVAIAGSTAKVSISSPELTAAQTGAVKAWSAQIPLAVGRPVRISTPAPLPAAGARITRTYAEPLPAGSAATLAYYDAALGAWEAVPSTLATDRRSVTAVVHHFSLWIDIASGAGKAWTTLSNGVQNAADWAYYQVGKVFDTRVGAPSCSGGKPVWLSSVTYIAYDRNNPLLFCNGTDPKQSELAVIKARVNRGIGFDATVSGTPSWQYNSTMDAQTRRDILTVLSPVPCVRTVR